MKRDPDLCREIMLIVEEEHEAAYPWTSIEVPGHSEEEVMYHVGLLTGAGLLNADENRINDVQTDWRIWGLTWKGHDFVEATRNSDIWTKTRSLTSKATGWTFDILKDVAVGLIKGELQKHGVPLG